MALPENAVLTRRLISHFSFHASLLTSSQTRILIYNSERLDHDNTKKRRIIAV